MCAERWKVCQVSLGLATGGLERLLIDVARFHDGEQFQQEFVALHRVGQPAAEIREAGCAVHCLAAEKLSRFALVGRLLTFFRERRYDVVHTHNCFPHVYATLAARLAGVPVVVHTRHGQRYGHGWRSRMSFRAACLGVDRVVAVSDDAARLCVAEDGVPARKVVRIWNGIDLQRFAWQGPASKLRGLAVARLSAEKDFPTLLRAMVQAVPQVPGLRLEIVGDGPERGRLERLRRELRLEPYVEFVGEQRDIAERLGRSGFFVLPSLTEGVSLTLLEAMAVGLPVLATAVGGNAEVVREGETGLLVPAGDPAAMAAGLVGMAQAQPRWRAWGQAGRERVEAYFDARQMLQHYEELYQELLTHKRVPARSLAAKEHALVCGN